MRARALPILGRARSWDNCCMDHSFSVTANRASVKAGRGFRAYSVLEYVLLLTSGSKLFSVNFGKSKTRGRRETGSRARLKDATAPRRRHARPQTEIDRTPEARGDPPPRPQR